VELTAAFDNTGSVGLNGSVMFLVQDAAGSVVARFSQDFNSVAPGARFNAAVQWPHATLLPRNCQLLVYAQFDGQTTAVLQAADWQDTPLRWHSASMADGSLRLSWPSVAGRRYEVLYTPRLDLPFTSIASGLQATPPINEYQHVPNDSAGYFRLKEEQ
jgi:hypothetical protein